MTKRRFDQRAALSQGTAGSALAKLFQRTAWTVAGQVLPPTFDGGRNKAKLAASRAAQQEKAIQHAFCKVSDALSTPRTRDLRRRVRA